MATIDLPGVEEGRNPQETVTNLFDAYIKLRRTIEHALLNLDSKNIKEIDAKLTRVKNLKAETIITNTLITNTLTAQKGYIADLTSDSFDTSDKVPNYKAEDISDVNYIRAYNEILEFLTAVTDGADTDPVYDRAGNRLYWLDATMVGLTTDVTDWPVTIYHYTELTKLRFYFKEIDGVKIPVGEWGAGNGVGDNGKAFMMKLVDRFRMSYIATGSGILPSGKEVKFDLTNNGILMDPPMLIFPDAFNATLVTATAETVLQGINVSFQQTTKVAFDVQMDIAASEAMTLLVKARIAGVEHRRTVKHFAGAYKDGLCFNGVFDPVAAGDRTVDITITPSAGTATIAIKEYRLMLTIRDGYAGEAAPWPEMNLSDTITVSALTSDSVTVVTDAGNNMAIEDTISTLITVEDSVTISLT